MFRQLAQASLVAFLGLAAPLSGNVALAQNDPSGGECNVLDTFDALFPACIHAYSALNRLEHLESIFDGADTKAQAVVRAELAYQETFATYLELSGGESVPGLLDLLPILAVAYIDKNPGEPEYMAGGVTPDTLIAKLTDFDRSDTVSIGDVITTHKYPTNFVGGEGVFQTNTHVITQINSAGNTRIDVSIPDPDATHLWVFEDIGGFAESFIEFHDAGGACCGRVWLIDAHSSSTSDSIEVRLGSPSSPNIAVDLGGVDPGPVADDHFLDIDIY